jgi:transposase
MILLPTGVRVWIAAGHTDMRRGMQSLALQVQEALKRDPHAGDLYVFRGRSGSLIKILWHDGIGSRSTPSGWSAAGLFGRRPRPAPFRSRRRNSLTCWTESIGEIPSTRGGRPQQADRNSCNVTHAGDSQVNCFVIRSLHDGCI